MNTYIPPIAMINIMNKNKKTSQGRKKIEIKKIEQVNNRQVTFSKRRAGLFKKASELCILTGAQIAILVSSNGGRFFAFGHPTVDVIIDRYLKADDTTPTSEGSSSTSLKPPLVVEFNHHYMEVSKELEGEKRRREAIRESKAVNHDGLPWYEEEVDGMEVDELREYLTSLLELKRKVLVRADELIMIKKTPMFLGPNMFDDIGGAGIKIDVHDTMTTHITNVMPPIAFDFGLGNNYNYEPMNN